MSRYNIEFGYRYPLEIKGGLTENQPRVDGDNLASYLDDDSSRTPARGSKRHQPDRGSDALTHDDVALYHPGATIKPSCFKISQDNPSKLGQIRHSTASGPFPEFISLG